MSLLDATGLAGITRIEDLTWGSRKTCSSVTDRMMAPADRISSRKRLGAIGNFPRRCLRSTSQMLATDTTHGELTISSRDELESPGSWVVKRRHQWHTFWNAGDKPCLIIETISPAGFENYFREVAAVWGDLEQFARINEKYSLSMDFESVPQLCRRFGLTFPELQPTA
jgi:hypothetical protein